MNVGVLGTGMVGSTIASRLVALGHEVKMGSREAGNEKARDWAQAAGANVSEGSFADAAAFGALVFNCTAGEHSIAALQQAGSANLAGKVLIDVANVLDFSGGRPPAVGVGARDSLGEHIQRAFPDVKVVKALNTMNCDVMIDPTKVSGEHHVFICGEDSDAKAHVAGVLGEFGWPAEHIVDLGSISAARGTEMYVALGSTSPATRPRPDELVRGGGGRPCRSTNACALRLERQGETSRPAARLSESSAAWRSQAVALMCS